MNLILMSTPNNSAQWMLFLLNKYSKMFFQGTWLTLYIAVLGTFIGFILGFTTVFISMGALAGTVGRFLIEYKTLLNVVTGLIVIMFGLSFLGLFNLSLFKGINLSVNKEFGFFSSLIFGFIF